MNKRDLKKEIYDRILDIIATDFHENHIKDLVAESVAERQQKWRISDSQQERINVVYDEVIEQLKRRSR